MAMSQDNVIPLDTYYNEFDYSLINYTSDLLNDTTNLLSNTSDVNASSSQLPTEMGFFRSTVVVLYVIVCCFGIVTNGLVIYVLLISARLERVTNIYILNLAIADFLYLVGIPFTVVTAIERMWIFGEIMCKVFYMLTSINWFTSVYTLAILSADRYFAICHAFWSIPYRTPTVARLACLGVWALSLVVMLPIILYSRAVDSFGTVSCTVLWPSESIGVDPIYIFIGYSFSLGFAVPLGMIVVFYSLVVLRLKGVGPNRNLPTKSIRSQQVQTKVTIMVTTVIAVNIICWLPYWIFQLVFLFADGELPEWVVLTYQLNTIINYANSAVNPVLYAFLSDSFRKSLTLVFSCFCTGSQFNKAYTCGGRNGTSTRRSRTSRQAVGEVEEVGTVEAEGGAPTCSVVLISDDVAKTITEWKQEEEDDEEVDAGQSQKKCPWHQLLQQQQQQQWNKEENDAHKDAIEMKTYPTY